MKTFKTSQNIGEIVSIIPEGSKVFKEYNIDFCCGGNRPLSTAIKEQSLDENEILSKLEQVYEESQRLVDQVDYRNLNSAELIDHIVNTHHRFTKKILPEISEFASTILRVHGPNHEHLFKVHKLFHDLKTELEQHLIKEEEILFPLIKKYEAKPSDDLFQRIINVMNETEEEHEGAGDILKEIRQITDDYTIPKDGCTTFELTYIKLQELEEDLFNHIHLENNILFRRFE